MSSLRFFWLKNYMNLSSPYLLHYPTLPKKSLNSVLYHKFQSERSVCSICTYRCETKHLPRSSFQDKVHCSCAVFKQGEISFYIKYWNIVYFKDTPVSLQGFMIVTVVWYVLHKLTLIFYLHLNCHNFWYSSKASDINWTWVREHSINTRGRSIGEKLKALCRFYYSNIFIVLNRVLFL